MLRTIGVVLIVLGLLGLVYGGFTYVKDRDRVEIGPLEMTVEEKETVPIPPILGVLGVLTGTALLLLSGRRRET